jgi:MFS transporter, DHA2 family, multidrug resistance protein
LTAATTALGAGSSQPFASPAEFSSARKFLIFGVMAFGQFMALIDIQIVAASLNDIQAGLSAAPEEISWIQTGYLIAELVMIPLSAFLSQALSTRWLFVASAGLFTVASALCGAAWDIESMILFRVIQGFVGGAMVPLVFATGFVMFSGPQRAMIPAILGMVSVLAPTLGPTVGGWLTDTIGWRSIFYINIVPGIAITVLAASLIRVDRPNLSMLKRIDYSHFVSMALFLGALQYVLEEGPKYEWFTEPSIAIAAWLSAVAFALFLERSFRSSAPIVNLSPFRRPTFTFACTFNFVIGFGLYASTYLIPVFLGQVRGFTSMQIGATVFVTGIAQIASTVIAARLSQRVDPRKTITAGLILFSLSLWLTSFIDPEWGFDAFLVPQALRGFAVMLCIVPSVGMALSGFDATELRYASALFNLMRNLGGAVGIAIANTWLLDQSRIHLARLGESLGAAGRQATEAIAALAARIGEHVTDPQLALLMAKAQFGQLASREASTLAFGEVFRIMSWIFLAALVMVPFCRPIMNAPAVKPVEH